MNEELLMTKELENGGSKIDSARKMAPPLAEGLLAVLFSKTELVIDVELEAINTAPPRAKRATLSTKLFRNSQPSSETLTSALTARAPPSTETNWLTDLANAGADRVFAEKEDAVMDTLDNE